MSLTYQNFGIEQPLMLFLVVPVAIVLFLYLRRPSMSSRRWILFLSRSFYVFLIALALAGPYLVETKEKFQDTAAVTILSDRSGSMDLFGRDDAQTPVDIYQSIRKQVKNSTGFDSTNLKEFSKDANRTEIGDILYQNSVEFSKEANLVILYTDGQNNYGRNPKDVAKVLGDTGTRILTVNPVSPKGEVYIAGITGEKKVPVNSEYAFTVDVGKVGADASYELNVYVNQKQIASMEISQTEEVKHVNLTKNFREEGVHAVTAVLIPKTSDHFKENNNYIKIVDVVEKPRILVVTREPNSPLTLILAKNYEVTVSNGVQKDLSPYVAVYLDNQNASTLSDNDIDVLHKYVDGGNGLVVVGGDRSFDKGGYNAKPNFESLLPVKSAKEPEKRRKEIAVLLVIDVSESTSYGQGSTSKIQHEKDLSVSILRQLDLNDYVGAIAFNVDAFTISDVKKLNDDIAELEDKIPRLTFGGGTDMLPALDRADKMLEGLPYAKYVIMISDGVLGTSGNTKSALALEKVKAMRGKGITTYTVGVGFDTDEFFMNELASQGGGFYYKSEEFQRLKMEFEEKDTDKDKEKYKLIVRDKNHYITSGLYLSERNQETSIKDYNDVTEKSVAQVLVTTEGKNPVVTAWRFGIGRVVCVSTDNGLRWSNNLYTNQNGRIVSSITNWAIGDLEKKKTLKIESSDIVTGMDEEFSIKSDKPPKAFFREGLEGGAQEITLKQVDLGVYAGRFTPNETGVYYLRATAGDGEDNDAAAVNYPEEFSRMGSDEKALYDLAAVTGENSYNATQITEIQEEALKFMKEGSLKKVESKTPLHIYFAIAAASLFFIDTVIRRINEIKRLGNK